MSTTDGRSRFVPAIECAPWCEYGDGHPDSFCREDQTCFSPASYVDLTLQPVTLDAGGVWPERLGVMARRDHASTVVYLHMQDLRVFSDDRLLDHSVNLTPEEAERLAASLIATARLVRATPAPPA